MMENKISLDNGHTYMTAHEAILYLKDMEKVSGVPFNKLWDNIAYQMDDEIRESVHFELAPCTEEKFLKRYLELSGEDFII